MGQVVLAAALIAIAVVAVVWLIARRRHKPAYQEGTPGHHFRVVEPLEVIRTVVEYVAERGGGWVMVEGVFGHSETWTLPVSAEPPGMLRRHTLWSFPKEQVLVVSISDETVARVSESFLPSTFGEAQHVQVADESQLVFGAYDNYEVAWVPEGALPVAILQQFEAQGLITRIEGIDDHW